MAWRGVAKAHHAPYRISSMAYQTKAAINNVSAA